jgi:hypothetical protein
MILINILLILLSLFEKHERLSSKIALKDCLKVREYLTNDMLLCLLGNTSPFHTVMVSNAIFGISRQDDVGMSV